MDGNGPGPAASMSFTISAFYKFVEIADIAALRAVLLERGRALDVKGTVLVAPEGINATVSGSDSSVRELLSFIRSDARFAGMTSKESFAAAPPFNRLRVRLKREIVAMGVPKVKPAETTGTLVPPPRWNDLLADPDIILVDTRNDYEVEIGSFTGALNPRTQSFQEFPAYVNTKLATKRDAKIAMFCTGGIRCEKASSYLLSLGFSEVFQLDGGILKYLETVPAEESLWEGECFVFDHRVAVKTGVIPGSYRLCNGCGKPMPKSAQADARCADCEALHPRKGDA